MSKKKDKVDLVAVWNRRKEMLAKGLELLEKGAKMRAKGAKLWAKENRFLAEGLKVQAKGLELWEKGDKLRVKGYKMWAEAILAVHGNIKVKWLSETHCRFETGEEFR